MMSGMVIRRQSCLEVQRDEGRLSKVAVANGENRKMLVVRKWNNVSGG